MKPIFTIHAGEYLVGSHIERTYPNWNVWIPSKDTGIDLLVTDTKNRKALSLQVKFSKDFNPTYGSPLSQNRLSAAGWWSFNSTKLQNSKADFWIFVLPSFENKVNSFIIISPGDLLNRYKIIHGTKIVRIQSYLRVTKSGQCWEARGLRKKDQERILNDSFADKNRNFTSFLNAWKQIETKLK